jgi:hypothetical protein
LFVPKIFVSALLIKEFLWALSTIWADTPFYAMMPGVDDGPRNAKKCKKRSAKRVPPRLKQFS